MTIADLVARAKWSVVVVRTTDRSGSSGSGVAVPGGVLTNAHVVGDAAEVELLVLNGRRVRAPVVRRDFGTDLALISTVEPIPVLQMDRALQRRQGDDVLTLGYPSPGVLGLAPTLTTGVLSAFQRDAGGVLYVQTNAAINPGNSGGALLDLSGRLIGVTTWAWREDAQGTVLEGLNFAIATETVLEFLNGRVWPTPTPRATPTPPAAATPIPPRAASGNPQAAFASFTLASIPPPSDAGGEVTSRATREKP